MTTRQSAVLDAAEDDFQEFVALARNGMSATADNTEHAAWRLAQAVIDDANGISKTALQGFSVFTAIAFQDATIAANLLESADTITA